MQANQPYTDKSSAIAKLKQIIRSGNHEIVLIGFDDLRPDQGSTTSDDAEEYGAKRK